MPDPARGFPDPVVSPTKLRLRELLHGFEVTQTLYVLAKLGIPDLVKDGPQSYLVLSEKLRVQARPLLRLMRMAATLDVLTQDAENRFGPTPLSELLQSGSPGSFRELTIISGEEYYRAAGKFLETVTTGTPGFQSAHGMRFFDYLAKHPGPRQTFNASMLVRIADHRAVANGYDFSQHRVVADVGGGRGGLIAEILRRHPTVRGLLFDQASVVPEADRYLTDQGVRDRCGLSGGDAFVEAPRGADTYIESYFLHDFEDGDAARILGHIREVIPPDGTLLLVEHVIPEGAEPSFGKLMDLRMLELGGLERTREEWISLLRRTGFHLAELRDVGIPARLAICRPI